MKGTKLWQEPRSPLISGRSRRERPFWRDLIFGTLLGVLIAAGGRYAFVGQARMGDLEEQFALAAMVIGGALIGCTPTIWVARRFGWRPAWVAGSVAALAGAVAVGAHATLSS